ncbi:hypothetical protein [Streptomyces sp. KL109B]|uniref:hypothetical protein n=2 Tax=unclassified Streptomyces TaxID=2593676 RepID=UPI00278BE1E0|nr:hypothetical protein [Streptomyces sp. KL109B]
MRAGVLAVSVTGVVVLAAAPVGAADAADTAGPGGSSGGSVTVTPAAAPAGTEVDLRVSGCEGATGSARSTAFVAPAELAPSADEPTLFAEARVTSSTTPGAYPVSVTCDGVEAKVKGTLRVLDGAAASASPTPSPTAPVHAGGGGTAHERQALAAHQAPAAAPSEGPGTRHALIGLGLAAVAAVAVAVRSVRRRRSADTQTRR